MRWLKIKEVFKGQWVELVDVEWKAHEPYPQSGTVRNHAPDRNELLEAVSKDRGSPESVILFVGAAEAFVDHANTLIENINL
jgi:hypothetical protein